MPTASVGKVEKLFRSIISARRPSELRGCSVFSAGSLLPDRRRCRPTRADFGCSGVSGLLTIFPQLQTIKQGTLSTCKLLRGSLDASRRHVKARRAHTVG